MTECHNWDDNPGATAINTVTKPTQDETNLTIQSMLKSLG